jgi:hypothetical protein
MDFTNTLISGKVSQQPQFVVQFQLSAHRGDCRCHMQPVPQSVVAAPNARTDKVFDL